MISLWKGYVPPVPTMREILEGVASRTGYTVEQLKGPRRPQGLAHARQLAMAEMYATGRFSLPQIGRFLGNRHHTTILHGVRAHNARESARQEAVAA